MRGLLSFKKAVFKIHKKIFKNNIIQGINSALLFLILNRSLPAGKDAVADLINLQHVFVSKTDN